MNDDADIARTVQIFEDALNVDAPAPDVDIIESRLIDSLGLVTLIYEIEQEFGVNHGWPELAPTTSFAGP